MRGYEATCQGGPHTMQDVWQQITNMTRVTQTLPQALLTFNAAYTFLTCAPLQPYPRQLTTRSYSRWNNPLSQPHADHDGSAGNEMVT